MSTAHLLEHLCTVKVAKYFTRFLSVSLPFFGSHDNRNGIEEFLGCVAFSCVASIVQIFVGVFIF